MMKKQENSTQAQQGPNILGESLSLGDRISDKVTETLGSWRFLIIQTAVLALWVILNITAFVQRWDPYPFILLNLVLSFQAAYAAPIIMMSQNRQERRDRMQAHNDYQINLKAEREVAHMMGHLDRQDKMLKEVLARLEVMAPEPKSND